MKQLTVRGLRVDRGGRRLLGPLDLRLHAGECLGLVGESGSGKSLTALALLGLLPHGLRGSGALAIDGEAIAMGSPTHVAMRGRVIGLVPQDPLAALHPLRRVGAQLRETLRAVTGLGHDAARDGALTLLEQVQLPQPVPSLSRYPHQFSGGQRQRIAIALALATRPACLIADEPTSALDTRIARDILDLLDRLRREHDLAVLLISHDLPLVGAYAQRVQVLRDGTTVESGPTGPILKAPRHVYTRALVEAGRLLPAATAAAREDAPLLQAQGLRLRYRGAAEDALGGVDIALHRGEALAVIGESGSGKSTLARALLRLVGARGRVMLDGVDVLAADRTRLRAMRRRIGIVFQDPYASLDPRMSIGPIIGEPLRIQGLDAFARRTRVAAALAAVGLDPALAATSPRQLSGGQRQRIAIARALISDPDLVICDEAVSALDAQHRAEVLRLLLSLKRERGLALLFITHDIAAAAAVAEHVAVLQHGRIVEAGPMQQVLRDPRHPHTRALLAARPAA